MATNIKSFFNEKEKLDIKNAIESAELYTSGEIRVHIEQNCEGDVVLRASKVFEEIGMTKTALRNGVLFYLALNNRKFAVLGDEGINNVVTPTFWDEIKHILLNKFRDGKFSEGLCLGIEMAGVQLKKFFPYQKNDVNELTNEVSYGDR